MNLILLLYLFILYEVLYKKQEEISYSILEHTYSTKSSHWTNNQFGSTGTFSVVISKKQTSLNESLYSECRQNNH